MPLSDACGGVSTFLEQRCDRRTSGFYDKGIVALQNAAFKRRPPAVPAREEGVARRRADRGRRVRVGEPHPILRQAVEIGSRNLGSTIVTAGIAVTKVI